MKGIRRFSAVAGVIATIEGGEGAILLIGAHLADRS